MFRWKFGKKARHLIPPDTLDMGREREDAAAARASAEDALSEAQDRTIEVRKVANTAKRLRAQNNFSAKITESFRSHNGQTAG